MTPAALSAAFDRASVELHVAADQRCVEIIAIARSVFKHRNRFSASQLASEMDDLRDAMRELNAAFTKLDLAHAAMTVGETASKIKAAAES